VTTAARPPRTARRPTVRPARAAAPAERRAADRTGAWRPAGRATPESWWVLGVGGALLALGLVMTFSASFVASTAETGDAFDVVARQALWAAAGVPVAALVATVDYRRWARAAGIAALGTLVALVLVLLIGEEVNGARRWFAVGPITLQPSEVVKLVLPMAVAHVLATRWRDVRRGDVGALLWPSLPLTAVAAVLVAATPDLESGALVFLVGLTPLLVAGLPGRVLALGVVALAAAGTWAIRSAPYRVGRVAAWLDPTNEAFRDGYGYQTTQGFIALGNGGVLGVGLGQGRGKWLYVPNAHTDFIYAIIGEELGAVGALLVLVAFAVLAWVGVRVALRAPDPYGRLLAAGITAWIVAQAAVNISSVVGVLPVTGVTLPLVSFGGSSLVVTMAGVGMLVAIARQAREDRPGAPAELP
jgi:cell division protein FtsW